MGRFYRTSSANPLDYMYRANIPLMERVIGANDQAITQTLDQSDKLAGISGAFPYLQQDAEDANKITQDYTKQVDDLTDAIRSDPANWNKQTGNIRDLRRKLETDYKTGKISQIMGNYNKYKSVSDYIDEQTKQYSKDGKGISADRANAYKQNFLSNFKGTIDKTTGQYNTINAFNPMNNIDVRKRLSDELDKMKADGQIKITDEITGNGQYFNKETEKWEGITPEKILRIVTGRLNDPQLMDYLKQDTQVGLVRGVYNDDPNSPEYGHFINPYSYDKVELSGAEQKIISNTKAQIDKTKDRATKEHLQEQLDNYTKNLENRKQVKWNDNSYLGPIMRSITDEFSHSKTDTENDLSANPIWQSKFTQSNENARARLSQQGMNDRQTKLLDQQKQLQDDRIQANKDLELLKQAGLLERAQLKDTKGTKEGATKNEIIGTTYASPFYHTTEDKDNLTPALNNEIQANKNVVSQLEAASNKIDPSDKVMKASADNQLANAKAIQNSLEARRQSAIDYAVNEWKAKGNRESGLFSGKLFGDAPIDYSQGNEQLLKSYLAGSAKEAVDQTNIELQKLNVQKAKLQPNTPEYVQFMRNNYYPVKMRQTEAQTKYETGQKIFNNEIKDASNNKIALAAKTTTNSADIVSTTKDQNETMKQMFVATPSSYKIMNKEGKEINLSFEHGSANPADVKILGAALSTGLDGKTVQIVASIKGAPVLIIPKGDGNKLESFVTRDFINSKDENVRNMGRIINSPIAGTINDMMTEMKMNTDGGYNTKDSWVYRTIQNPSNPKDVVNIRIRQVDTGNKPKWEMQAETENASLIYKSGSKYDIDGKTIKGYVPLPSADSKDGIYNSLEDILKRFPSK